jgi:hypothetical protein
MLIMDRLERARTTLLDIHLTPSLCYRHVMERFEVIVEESEMRAGVRGRVGFRG